MALTPLDIENYRLRTAFRGYSREDVDRLLAIIVRGIEDYVHQIGQLSARTGQLEAELQRYRESEELLTKSVMLAEKTRDELISAAELRAVAIREEAQSEAERIRNSIADVTAQREHFEYAFHGLLTGFINRLESGNPRLAAQRQAAASALPPLLHEAEARDVTPPAVSSTGPLGQAAPLFTAPQQAARSDAAAPTAAAAPAAARQPQSERDADIGGFEAALAEARPVAPRTVAPPAPSPVEAAQAPALAETEPVEELVDSSPTYHRANLGLDTEVLAAASRMDEEEPHFVIRTPEGDVYPEHSLPEQDEAENDDVADQHSNS